MDFLELILEIPYGFIKCIIKFFAWIFKIAMKDIFISLLSFGILCCIIFSFIMPKVIFSVLLLLMFIYLVFKFRGEIRRYLNKKGFL
ncbi:hypothetical protein LY16_02370 [Xenorhabdus doucetiae]|uniref:Uncharacterized protein n=1 Tax=Xenorhabdus doucetiae TaxID=351671 RepID=A0ABY3NQ66_9GAMM|nr:hypothetical protein LY16_02370 [Xenorhabdus doucetiae]